MSLPYPTPPLDDGDVRLRRWKMTDLECVRLAAADPRIPEGTTVPAEFTPEAGSAFIRRQWGRNKTNEGISLAITESATDVAIGLVVLLRDKYEGVYEVGHWLIPDARGHGRAAHAVRLVSRWALGQRGIHRIQAHVNTENVASLQTLLKAGFEQEGVLRRYLNIHGHVSDAAVLSVIT
jgi:[ribosomal protein S5]-alanine N-acetyltransferase